MNALIIGFGGMGCRHAQSLIASGRYGRIEVVEPSDSRFSEGMQKIGADPAAVRRVRSIAEASPAEITIVATSSEPRFAIMRELLTRGYRNFLVEKIVFQSASQFDEIIGLLNIRGAQAYCNYANRYYPTYVRLSDTVKTVSTPIEMSVISGDIGIGCNAVHYMDLFEYLTGSRIASLRSSLTPWTKENKRGNVYRELSGLLTADSVRGDVMTLYFDPSHNGYPTLLLEIEGARHVISEGSCREFVLSGANTLVNDFPIIPTSKLTASIATDILAGTTRLTTVQETRNIHLHLFREINQALQLPDEDTTLCPIT